MSATRALAPHSPTDSGWTVVGGPHAGTQVKLGTTQFAIGRSHECEIPLPYDPKVSRKHARVYYKDGAFRIQSLVSQNPVLINGRPISDSEIHSGTIIQLGETELRFDGHGNMMTTAQPLPPLSLAPNHMPMSAQQQPNRPKKRSQPKASGSPLKRILIYGTVAGLLWWLFGTETAPKKNPFEIRSEKQIEVDIKEANELRELAEKSRADRLNPTVSERNAQEHYVKGFRDFRKGQYERSISSFQACLALHPDHQLCNRYLKLSQKKFGELVQYHMVLGRKYRDQNQYRACRSAFRNVMVMVRDPSNSLYNEARSNYTACNSLVEGRF